MGIIIALLYLKENIVATVVWAFSTSIQCQPEIIGDSETVTLNVP